MKRLIRTAAVFSLLLSLSMSPFTSVAWANKDAIKAPPARVNINTADVETLADVLNGVGDKKAQAIVTYREQYGPFASVDELLEVKGVGKALLETNRRLIVIE